MEFAKVEPILEGWSGDKKYCVTKEDGIRCLLRISPMEQYDRKKSDRQQSIRQFINEWGGQHGNIYSAE